MTIEEKNRSFLAWRTNLHKNTHYSFLLLNMRYIYHKWMALIHMNIVWSFKRLNKQTRLDKFFSFTTLDHGCNKKNYSKCALRRSHFLFSLSLCEANKLFSTLSTDLTPCCHNNWIKWNEKHINVITAIRHRKTPIDSCIKSVEKLKIIHSLSSVYTIIENNP